MSKRVGSGTQFPSNLEYFIKEYQRTKEPQYFHKVLARVDLLIAKMIWQERRKCKALQMVSNQDLYHTSIIALHEALMHFDIRRSSIHSFPRLLQGYMRNNFLPIIRQYERAIACGIDAALFEDTKRSCEIAQTQKRWYMAKIIVSTAVEAIKKQDKVSDKQWKAFWMRYEKDASYADIAKKLGGNEKSVEKAVRIVRNRVKDQIRRLGSIPTGGVLAWQGANRRSDRG